MQKSITAEDCIKLQNLMPNVPIGDIKQFFGLEENSNSERYKQLKIAFKIKNFEAVNNIAFLVVIQSNEIHKIHLEMIKGFKCALTEAEKAGDIETISKIKSSAPCGSEVELKAANLLNTLCPEEFNRILTDKTIPGLKKLSALAKIISYLPENTKNGCLRTKFEKMCAIYFALEAQYILDGKKTDFSALWTIYGHTKNQQFLLAFLLEMLNIAIEKENAEEINKVCQALPVDKIKEINNCLAAILNIAIKQKDAQKILEVGQKATRKSLRKTARTELVKLIQ